MSESTEIANAIYHLASTIKSAVTFLSFIALLLWMGSVLSTPSKSESDGPKRKKSSL